MQLYVVTLCGVLVCSNSLLLLLVDDCFTGLGRGYNGTRSITQTGKTCQAWNTQAPHQFILPAEQYPEIAGGHNYCRNPGSRAPGGPWCFTTDPDTRWEYCDVPKCSKYLSEVCCVLK